MSLEPAGGGFSADPFDLKNSSLRAGMRDREELARILSDAYADGKLDDAEYQERLDSALQIKLLGEVRTLVIDLGTPKTLMRRRKSPAAARQEARQKKRAGVREAAVAWVSTTAIVNIVYFMTALAGGFYYYWPMWPMLAVTIALIAAIAAKPQDQKSIEKGDED